MGSRCVSLPCSTVEFVTSSNEFLAFVPWFLTGSSFQNQLWLLSIFNEEGGKDEVKKCGVLLSAAV